MTAKLKYLKLMKWAALEPSDRKCAYCQCEMRLEPGYSNSATVDHVVPQSQGGAHNHANTALVCLICNVMRGDMSVEAFLSFLTTDFAKVRRDQLVQRQQQRKKGKKP